MLEILQYSMNAVFPILLLIVLGYYAKRAGMLSEQTIAQINRFNFRYGYFCLMFVNIYGVDLKEGLPVTMIALVLGIIALLTVVGWVAASFLTKERSRKGVLIQASFRSNYAIIGMMMAQALAGDEGAALVAIFQLPAVLYYNSVSVLAMSIYSDSGNKPIGLFGLQHLHLHLPASRLNPDRPDRKFPPLRDNREKGKHDDGQDRVVVHSTTKIAKKHIQLPMASLPQGSIIYFPSGTS